MLLTPGPGFSIASSKIGSKKHSVLPLPVPVAIKTFSPFFAFFIASYWWVYSLNSGLFRSSSLKQLVSLESRYNSLSDANSAENGK